MDIYVTDEQDVPLPIEPLRSLARLVLESERLPAETEVGIAFVTDEVMSRHNRRFLGGEGPTDVLALPLIPPEERVGAGAGRGLPYALGDVFVAPRFVLRQAESSGADFEAELSLMVTHGLLHLIGHDHGTESEAIRMEARERDLLARIGVERR